jgi:Domain of unknown function (DUF932)
MNLETVLTDDQLREYAPSIFATQPQEGASEIYQFLPTSSILSGMRDQGWVPVEAQEQKVQSFNPQHRGFQKHLIRFARTRDLERMANKMEPGKHIINRQKPLATRMDILVINSHDRTSGYQLFGAPKRLICYNGLVVSDATMQHLSIRHVGFDPAKVVAASLGMAEVIPMVLDTMASWQDRVLTDAEKAELAERALGIRWDDPKSAPIGSKALLTPRRYEDNTPDLWTVWNTVQENLIKGGQRDRERTIQLHMEGKRAKGKTRPVVAIDENLRINRALWDLADEFSQN